MGEKSDSLNVIGMIDAHWRENLWDGSPLIYLEEEFEFPVSVCCSGTSKVLTMKRNIH